MTAFYMDRVPLEQVVDKAPPPEENKAVQQEPERIEQMGFQDDPDYHRTADALEISYDDRKDSRVAEKVQYLMEWAKESSGKEDRVEQLLALKQLQKMLGFTEKGLISIKKLYQWTRLDSQRRRIEKQMEII